jgi:hypothetical protein
MAWELLDRLHRLLIRVSREGDDLILAELYLEL